MAFWHCGEPTCTWTVAAWRLHTPFSLGITIVFSLSADASQMVCYRIKCKVALNYWSVALSYAHVVCARLFITWSALITPHTQSHTDTPTHPPNAPFWHAVSPHISEQNWTNWQWQTGRDMYFYLLMNKDFIIIIINDACLFSALE